MEFERTGIDGLDIVTGGLPRHALTMLIGAPGTGKTVLSLQLAAGWMAAGRDVVFLSVFAEPHEKLIEHMHGFSFFDASLVGRQLELLSIKASLQEGAQGTLNTIFRSIRGKNKPLIILDGYRGLRNLMGPPQVQEFMAGLSSQLPYHNASCIISSEAGGDETDYYPELASADAVIVLRNTSYGLRAFRTIEVLKMRSHGYLEGLHGMNITGDGIVVYPRLATVLPAGEPLPTGQRLGFALPEFDAMLHGGLPEFSTTVIFGDPGTGKTTLGLQFLLEGASRGEKGLLVTFRESVPELLAKADELGLGLRAAVEENRVEIVRIPPTEVNPFALAWEMREIVTRRRDIRLVIDGVTELERSAGTFSDPVDFLVALSEALHRSAVTTVMLKDNQPGVFTSSGEITSVPTAQNRILLRRVEYAGTLYRILAIITMQFSEHDPTIREFRIGKAGITILRPDESKPDVLRGITEDRPISMES